MSETRMIESDDRRSIRNEQCRYSQYEPNWLLW